MKVKTLGTQLDSIHKVPASQQIAEGADSLLVEKEPQGVSKSVILVFQSERRRVICFVHGVTRSPLMFPGNCLKTAFVTSSFSSGSPGGGGWGVGGGVIFGREMQSYTVNTKV